MNASKRALKFWYTFFGVMWTFGVIVLLAAVAASRPW